MKKKDSGFAQILLVSLLPFLLGALIALYVFAGATQLQAKIQGGCRKEQIQTQVQVRNLLEKLLNKNITARQLKAQLLATQAILLVSPTNAPALARLKQLQFKRQALDFYQKSLIAAANALLLKASWKIYARAQAAVREQRTHLQPLAQVEVHILTPPPQKLAVDPEYPDTAPPYRPRLTFSEDQALVQKWQYRLQISKPLQNYIHGDFRFEKLCSTTLAQQGDQWILVTAADKF